MYIQTHKSPIFIVYIVLKIDMKLYNYVGGNLSNLKTPI